MPFMPFAELKSFTPRDMPPNAWGKLRAKLAQNGYSNRWIKDQLGSSIGGRKTAEIIEALKVAMNTDEARDKARERKPVRVAARPGRGRRK